MIELKIQYLLSFMESLKRIKIRNKVVEELEVNYYKVTRLFQNIR